MNNITRAPTAASATSCSTCSITAAATRWAPASASDVPPSGGARRYVVLRPFLITLPPMRPIQNIVIVGGGTAGWLTAGVIAARTGADAARLHRHAGRIADVPIIGVGEGTWPTLRATLRASACPKPSSSANATPRSSRARASTAGRPARRRRWLLPPVHAAAAASAASTSRRTGSRDEPDDSFCDTVSRRAGSATQGSAPRRSPRPNMTAHANYAYHLDAGKFSHLPAAALLRQARRAPRPRRRHRGDARRERRHRQPRHRAGGERSRATCSSTAPASARC